MSRLSSNEKKMIRRVCLDYKRKVPNNPSWRSLLEELGITPGIERKALLLSASDINVLKQVFENETGRDIRLDLSEMDRMETVNHTPYDKDAGELPFQYRISVTTVNAALHYEDDVSETLANIDYGVDYRKLDVTAYDYLVVVENAVVPRYIKACLSNDMGRFLIIYKGHNDSVKALDRFLETLPDNYPVACFYDADIAGLGMVMNRKPAAKYMLFPCRDFLVNVEETKNIKISKDVEFLNQLKQRPEIKKQSESFSEDFQACVSWVHKRGISISQEWLCANKVPLRLIRLNTLQVKR